MIISNKDQVIAIPNNTYFSAYIMKSDSDEYSLIILIYIGTICENTFFVSKNKEALESVIDAIKKAAINNHDVSFDMNRYF